MGHHKLFLDDDIREDFSLIAIHCSEEAYKMAYMLNKYLFLKLRRKPVDLDYSNDGLEVTFPIFEFENEFQYTVFHLIANKCKSKTAQIQSSGGLFDQQHSEKTVLMYLLPEFKNVDFFLKIDSDFETSPVKKIVSGINEIKEVISAYSIEVENIRSKNNLIFD